MQAQSFLIAGLPIMFYRDELGYTNDYSYLKDLEKSYKSRWMHRLFIDLDKKNDSEGTIEHIIFRKPEVDHDTKRNELTKRSKNITWLRIHNIHIAGFFRPEARQKLYCLFKYSGKESFLTSYAFKEYRKIPLKLYDL